MEELEKRVIALEEKYSFQDDLVDKLNKIVAEQDRAIHTLVNQVQQLSEALNRNQSSQGQINLEDEVPPHY